MFQACFRVERCCDVDVLRYEAVLQHVEILRFLQKDLNHNNR